MSELTLETKLLVLQTEGLYEVLFRNAGVGLRFYEGKYEDGRPVGNWSDFLAVHGYHPTLTEAVDAELTRLGLAELATP